MVAPSVRSSHVHQPTVSHRKFKVAHGLFKITSHASDATDGVVLSSKVYVTGNENVKKLAKYLRKDSWIISRLLGILNTILQLCITF